MNPEELLRQLTERFAAEVLRLSQREVRSQSIRDSLRILRFANPGTAAVESAFYWAVYYHDGRGPVRARPGHKLVYFQDISQDPRVPGRRYPVRYSQVRRLTAQQFYRLLRDPSSGMIVRDRVGPSKGDPFFTRAGRQFLPRTGALAAPLVSAFVRQALGDLLNINYATRISL